MEEGKGVGGAAHTRSLGAEGREGRRRKEIRGKCGKERKGKEGRKISMD